MKREIIRCPEGYWNLIDDRGTLLCRFKLGCKVKIVDKPFNCDWERTIEGTVKNIIFGKTVTIINIRKTYYMETDCRLNDIVSMEVIKK